MRLFQLDMRAKSGAGVRPSPGAETLDQSGDLERLRAVRLLNVSAPGDGRTPDVSRCAWVALGMACFVWLSGGISLGAESSGKGELDSYLKLLGYEMIQLKGTEKSGLLVEGRIGDKKGVFLLDSGCTWTILDERSARAVKRLGDLGGSLEDGRFGTITDPSVAIIEKLSFGRAQFMNQPARVETIQMEYLTTPYDGILGCDFYFRNFCLIDCALHRLYVRSRQLSEQQAKDMAESFRRSGFIEVPTTATSALSARVEINGNAVELLADTGSWTSLLDEEQSKPLRLSRYTEKDTSTHIPQDVTVNVVGMGKIGTHHARLVVLKDLQLGSRRLSNMHFGVCNLNAWGKPSERKWIGVVGQDVLENQGALLDFSGGKIWLSHKQL